MAIYLSIPEIRLRRILVGFFVLASLLPVIISLYTVSSYVIPALSEAQVENLRDPFSNTILLVLLLQCIGFILFWRWVASWETIMNNIKMIAAEILKKKSIENIGENELSTLHELFMELRAEYQKIANRLNAYFKRSITDDMTCLFNRSYFEFKLTEESRKADMLKEPFSLILFSLDDFHRHSTEIGDKLLQDFGELMRKLIRRADLPFRYGRNNFAIILPCCGGRIAEKVATRLSQSVSRHAFVDPKWLPLGKITISCGVAVYDGDMKNTMGLANEALNRAQDIGGGNIAGISNLEITPDLV
ncbi:hypothetical protein D3OALGA1CA_803 [Olavius algarvensis associated proteobacterium Delta 3]|nr:hypothetical protein D3OALGA1CA_803 [Olavius algarvensis associated proteobacterium Delta 3]CAB5142417.1 hypothetical protein D3OALGB2SA_4307 [Olavius algarvensis associated proteobacterium Delta 3]